jgi:predicted secreted protein
VKSSSKASKSVRYREDPLSPDLPGISDMEQRSSVGHVGRCEWHNEARCEGCATLNNRYRRTYRGYQSCGSSEGRAPE